MIEVLAGLVFCVVIVLLIPAMRGAGYKSSGFEAAIKGLVDCGLEPAFMRIRPRYSTSHFVQFSRILLGPNQYGVRFDFPHADWSDDIFPKVVSEASRLGLTYEVLDDESGLRFVLVSFGNSISKPASFARFVLFELMGYSENYTFRIRIN